MASSFFPTTGSLFAPKKAYTRTLFVFLWMSAVCLYMVFPAYAASSELLQDGMSGSCTWKYEKIDINTVLTIAPANGPEGTLASFSWGNSQYTRSTTHVVVRGKVNAGPSTDSMFEDFERVRSIDLSGLDITGVTSMRRMFSGCTALASLDLSGWSVADETQMEGMFANTVSLRSIRLGSNFSISSDAEFESAGSRMGTRWMQVNHGKDGTPNNPKGEMFESSSALIAFHRDRTRRETDVEEYLRVAPVELVVSFNGGADAVSGEMLPQVYTAGATEPLAKNVYKRAGYTFGGWKDLDGNYYADEQPFENNRFGRVLRSGGVMQKVLELFAQWKAIVTYEIDGGTRGSLYRTSEEIDSRGDPLGSEVVVEGGIPEDNEIEWTVKAGGNSGASDWSHRGIVLGKDEVKAAILKDGEFVPTTFVAELVDL